MIIVYDSFKFKGISLCVITIVASPAIIFIIVANIVNVIVFSLQHFSGAYFEDIRMYVTTTLE